MLFSNFFKKISVLYKRKSDALNYNKCVRFKLILCGLRFFLLAFNKEDNKERNSRENYYRNYYHKNDKPSCNAKTKACGRKSSAYPILRFVIFIILFIK